MITLQKVNTEIAEIYNTDRDSLKPGQKSRLKSRLSLLKVVRNYLETAPTEEFCMVEKRRIQRLVTTKSDSFGQWKEGNKDKGQTDKELWKAFEKEYDFKKLRQQIKALGFIINKD